MRVGKMNLQSNGSFKNESIQMKSDVE